jgi:hypothetical protein
MHLLVYSHNHGLPHFLNPRNCMSFSLHASCFMPHTHTHIVYRVLEAPLELCISDNDNHHIHYSSEPSGRHTAYLSGLPNQLCVMPMTRKKTVEPRMPLTAARHVLQHYQLQITSKTNKNSSTLDKNNGAKKLQHSLLRLHNSGM